MSTGLEGGKRSAWMSHVKRTMKANKGKSLMQVLKMAKKTYKKTGGGGGGVATGAAEVGGMMGGRRRRGGVDDGAPVQSQSIQDAKAAAIKQPETPPIAFAPTPTRKRGGKTRKSGRKSRGRTRKH
jgi:hypothetical protein